MGEKIITTLMDVKKWNPIWLVLPGLVLSLTLYTIYIALAQPQVPYMDSMLYLVQVEKILRGEITWFSVYGSGEHRGLIFPFVLLVEWIFWAVDARITTLLTGVVVAATFFYWLRSLVLVRFDIFGESRSSVKTFILAIAAAFIIVSPAAFELWTLDLGFAQLVKNLLIVLFFYQLSVTRVWNKNFICALLFGSWGGFLILFATYGWSYSFLAATAFAVVCIFYSEPHARIKVAVVLVIMVLAQYLYIRLGHGVFSNSQYASQDLAMLELVKGMLYGASSSFMGTEVMTRSGVPVIAVMLFGGLLLVCSCIALIRTLITPSPVKVFAAALLVFSLTVLAGVTLARGATNYFNTGASRYFVDYVWLLLAPVLIFTKSVDTFVLPSHLSWLGCFPLQKIYDVARLLMALLLGIAFLGHLLTWSVELKAAPYRAEVFKSMANVYRQGVIGEPDANLLQSPYDVARRGVSVAQRYNLAVFRTETSLCNLKTAAYTGDWYSAEQDGSRWMGKQAVLVVSKCAGPVILNVYIPKYFSARTLKIGYDDHMRAIQLEPGASTSITLDDRTNKRDQIELSLDTTTNPSAQGVNADGRDLGMLLTFIGTD